MKTPSKKKTNKKKQINARDLKIQKDPKAGGGASAPHVGPAPPPP